MQTQPSRVWFKKLLLDGMPNSKWLRPQRTNSSSQLWVQGPYEGPGWRLTNQISLRAILPSWAIGSLPCNNSALWVVFLIWPDMSKLLWCSCTAKCWCGGAQFLLSHGHSLECATGQHLLLISKRNIEICIIRYATSRSSWICIGRCQLQSTMRLSAHWWWSCSLSCQSKTCY